VIVTTGPSGEAILLNAPEDHVMPVPVAVMAPKDSRPFQEAAAAGAEATFVLDGDATPRNSTNIIGRLERGNRWLVISTPRQDGSIVSVNAGPAHPYFSNSHSGPSKDSRGIRFTSSMRAHTKYYFAGSHKVMDLAPPPQSTDLWTHIGATVAARDADESGPALRLLDTADPQRSVMATTNLNAAVAEGFRGIKELERPQPVRADAGELSVFTDRGYSRCFAVLGLHRWLSHDQRHIGLCGTRRLVTPVLEAHKRTMERGVAEA
jgi:hypothetical protein